MHSFLLLTNIRNPIIQIVVARRVVTWFDEIFINDFWQNFEQIYMYVCKKVEFAQPAWEMHPILQTQDLESSSYKWIDK